MMALLFFIYLVSFAFIIKGQKKAAITVVLINIVLCLIMFNHHMTLKLNLNF